MPEYFNKGDSMEMGREFKECRKYLRKKDNHIGWFDDWKGYTYKLRFISLTLMEILEMYMGNIRVYPKHTKQTWQEFNDRFMPGNCLRIISNRD